jgi:CheY-like chemotaxis protein
MSLRGPIVIVEDDLDDQYLYQRTFEKLKIENQLLFFGNGKEALTYLTQPAVRPFVILSDINMPLMTGLQLRKQMCNDPVLSKMNTPFIFLSTSAREEDMDEVKDLCVQGFFRKESSYDKHVSIIRLIVEYWKKCYLLQN